MPGWRKQQDAGSAAQPAAAPPAIDFDTGAVDKAMGSKGTNTGGIYQFTISRAKPVTEDGMEVPPPGPLGLAIGINFQPTGNNKAAVTGDFVLAATRSTRSLRRWR